MDWLNYHHLLYFWVVAREGSITRASQELRLTQPTISAQILALEETLGEKLFIRAFNHLLGECGVTIFGTERLAAAYRPGFPESLNGAPFLLPTDNTTLRRSLDQWFEAEEIGPVAVGEFEDSALLKSFGQAGVGLFASPSVIESKGRRQYGVEIIGRVEAVRECFYAISVERKLKHPAVVAISEAARQKIFG